MSIRKLCNNKNVQTACIVLLKLGGLPPQTQAPYAYDLAWKTLKTLALTSETF